MAGDWIKFELATLDKPEVCQMADMANVDMDAVVGKLLRVWGWFDQHTENGNAPSVSKRLLDRLVGVTGFCDSMKSVGWMHEDAGVISLPRFERHNGKTAKNRLLTAKRVANHKAASAKNNARGNDVDVSDALPREDLDTDKDQEQKPPLPPRGEPDASVPGESCKPSKPAKASTKFDPLSACPPNVTPDVWARWVRCRKEQGKPLKQTTCDAQAQQLAGHPAPDAVIEKSIAAGWQGLFPDGVPAQRGNVHALPSSRHHNFADRDYFDGLVEREDGTYGL